MTNKKIGYRILHFPLTKIIIGIVVLVAVVTFVQMGIDKLLDQTNLDKDIKNLVISLSTAILSISAYTLLFRFYEKRKIIELSPKRIGRNLLTGMLLGALLQSLTILVIWLNGGYTVVSVNHVLFLIPPLAMAVSSAIFEEILVRGIIFRLIEEKLGSYLALIISALIFGALHLGNPGSTLITALGLAIQAGLLLGAAFIYSKNLWFPIAIHFAWNFTQSAIYGASVSGNAISKTLISSKIDGKEWYTGGAFGPEGSIQATLFCFIATICLMVLNHRENKIVRPFWRKANV